MHGTNRNPQVTMADFKRPLFQPPRTEPCFCGSGKRFKACCGSMAEVRAAPHGVHILSNYLPVETCRQWTQHFEGQPRGPLAVHSLDDSAPERLAKERISGRITDKVDQGALAGQVVDTIKNAYQHVVAAAMNRTVEWFENPQILRYEPGGVYGPHSDSDHFIPQEGLWQKVIDRDISLLLYLNQEFEGGELHFHQFNYTYRPRTGDLLFFPSNGQYAHQALPVKSGIRYVVVSWAAYRDEPRVLEMRPADCIDLDA